MAVAAELNRLPQANGSFFFLYRQRLFTYNITMTTNKPTFDEIILYAMGDADEALTQRCVSLCESDVNFDLQVGDIKRALKSAVPPNLKLILMELGNKLVTEHGAVPQMVASSPTKKVGTGPICEFTEFINNTPAAQQVLAELGVEWPM